MWSNRYKTAQANSPTAAEIRRDKRNIKRKRRRGRFVRSLLGLVFIAMVAGLVGAVAWVVARDQFYADGPLKMPKNVVVARGSSTAAIGKTLEQEGVVTNALIFRGGVLLNGAQSKLKAGEYRFPEKITMEQVIDLLISGKSVVHKVTIPEGLTTQLSVERIAANDVLVGEIEGRVPEGSILPGTYVFDRGDKRADVLAAMKKAQQKLVMELWPGRAKDLPITTPREAVILASIVEKETGIPEERGHVASVFVNRLKKGMRLQSDPTIIYGIVGGQGKLGRPIKRSEIDAKTPYNTYQIDGLPPTPITNPGKEAIAAVLNPDVSDDLYFVADGSGGHVFSKTLQEHELNVRKLRAIEVKRRREQLTKKPAEDGSFDQAAFDAAARSWIAENGIPIPRPKPKAPPQ